MNLAAKAQQGTATIGANSRSLYLGPMTHSEGGVGTVTTYFTTFDGRTDRFPLYQQVGFTFLFSGELRPIASQPDSYEADYATQTPSAWREYGSLAITLPSDDTDSNGLPDICQLNKTVNTTIGGNRGSMRIDWPFQTVDSFTLYMSRASNQISGTYWYNLWSNASQSVGTLQLLNITGSVAYHRVNTTLNFTFAITDPLSSTRTVSGATTYTVASPNQIIIPQFSVTASGGPTYTFQSGCTLNRTGSRFVGTARLNDGIPETSWADFVDWVIEIQDPNDWDGNGIPDISDSVPIFPFIIDQPQSRTAILNSTTNFAVFASGTHPLRYQWQKTGTNLINQTNSILTIPNVQFASAGDYRVIVSNGAGSITSQVATLTVIFPPSITDQPEPATAIAGQSAQFNVGAIGTDPLYYQWRHGATNVPGANQPILFIQPVQERHAGMYSVVVSNAAGTVTSSGANLTVVVPITITSQPQSLSEKTNARVTFSVGVTGSSPIYRWMRNGTNVPGGINSTLVLNNVRPESAGLFNVRVSNFAGSQLSSNAILYVGLPLTVTNFTRTPAGVVRADVIGEQGSNYIFQSSVNLSNWVSVATNSAPYGILTFFHTNSPATTRRFYRAKGI